MATTTRFSRPGRFLIGITCLVISWLMAACGGSGADQAVAKASASDMSTGNKTILATAATVPIANGWYWNPAESGTGFMVEAQGSRAFVGFFMYEALTGKPIWYTATGDLALGTDGRYAFTGDLRRYQQGQAVTSTSSRTPTSSSVGPVRIVFQGRQATAALPGGRSMAATRFDIAGGGYNFDNPPAARRDQPETGWYWNPGEAGRGYAIEVQNNRVFVGMFHYNEDGSPTWNIVDADLSTGVASGVFNRFFGGQTLTSAYRGPLFSGIGSFSLSFRSACAGQVQFDGLPPVGILRYRIDGSVLPPGGECRAVNDDAFPMPTGLTQQPAMLQPGDAVYGRLVASGEFHAYGATLRGGQGYVIQLQGAAANTGTLAQPQLKVYASISDALPTVALSADSFAFTPPADGIYFLTARAADGGTGSYLLRLSGAATHLPSQARNLSSLAGRYEGSLNGRGSATVTLTVDSVGQVSGTLSLAQGGALEALAVTGNVRADGTLQFVARGSAGEVAVDGFLSAGGVVSGAWRDASGAGGLVIAQRAPAQTNTAPVAVITGTTLVLPGVPEALTGIGSSDADGDTLTYTWQLLTRPQDSDRATLVGTRTPTPTFTADVAGPYRILLTVDDGRGGQSTALVVVNARSFTARPYTLAFTTPSRDTEVFDADADIELTLAVLQNNAPITTPVLVTLTPDTAGLQVVGASTRSSANGQVSFRVRGSQAHNARVSARVTDTIVTSQPVRRQFYVRPSPCRQQVLVPAYFSPNEYPQGWELLIAWAARPELLTWVVFNPANGPGAEVDRRYPSALGRFQQAGGKLLAYLQAVGTPPSLRPVADIVADLRRYGASSHYPGTSFSGVFIDGAQPIPGQDATAAAARLQHFLALRQAIRSEFPALRVFVNTGGQVAEVWADAADVLVTFDDAAQNHNLADRIPANRQTWAYQRRNDSFATLIHDAAPSENDLGGAGFGQLLSESVSPLRNSGYIYITDGTAAEAFYTRPSVFLDSMIGRVASFNTARPGLSCTP